MSGVRLTLMLRLGLVVAATACGGATVQFAPPAPPAQQQVVVRADPKPATPPPPIPTAVEIPGEGSVAAVAPMPSVRWPHVDVRRPMLTSNVRDSTADDLYFDTRSARSATTLAEALKVPDRLGSLAPNDKERFPLLFFRAKQLAGLAQATFADEPNERQGRLRAVALHAALDAYKEALASTPWDTREGCRVICPTRGWFLYFEAMLFEQAGDRANANATYKQVLDETVMTLAGTRRRWVEGMNHVDGLCHLGLATVAEAANEPCATCRGSERVRPGPGVAQLRRNDRGGRLRPSSTEHRRPPQLDEPADDGRSGCVLLARERERAAEAAVTRVWLPVEQVGDDIAKKMWIVEYETSKLGQMSPPQRAATMQQIQGSNLRIAGLIRQAFCPTKKGFVASAGQAEFTKRAAAH